MTKIIDTRMKRRDFLRASVAAAAVGGVASLGLGSRQAFAQAGTLNFQASWINDAEFMGYFIAIENGYYAAEGLSVNYLSGGPDVIPESTLISGRADIALTSPDTTIRAITEQGAPFKIIGQQYQKNPIGVVSLAASNINSPADLVGKTLAVPPVNTTSVEAMFRLAGVPIDQVRIVPYQFDPTPLIQEEIDASIDFVTAVPYIVEQAGKVPVWFLLYDYGFKIGNDTIVVTEETLANRRSELVSWLRASRQGWEENAVDLERYPAMYADSWFAGTGRSTEVDTFQNVAQEPLQAHPDGYFSMTEETIAETIASLAEVGITATRDMFDTTLLEEI